MSTSLDSLFSRSSILNGITNVGAYATGLGRDIAGMVGLFYDTVSVFLELDRKGYQTAMRQITSQILFTGVEALWLVSTIALVAGSTTVILASTNMPKLGASEYFGGILVMVLIKELGPFFTALVVIGRSGSGLATYIAGMKVSKEVSALRAMGIDPLDFIVMPAFAGMVVSTVCLSVYFDVVGILGGLTVSSITANTAFDISIKRFLEALAQKPWDIGLSLFKNVIFGIIIAVVSCYHGMAASNPREVPKAARKAVVGSMVAALLVNILITALTFSLK
jgi:phospholipid/cholesterol/gamma-HCH transport system permease protein